MSKHDTTNIVSTIFVILCTMMVSTGSLSFNLTTFDNNDGNVKFYDDAYAEGGEIRLTKNRARRTEMSNTTGRVVYRDTLRLWDEGSGEVTDFSTCFSFIIDSLQSNYFADGMAFFLAHPDLPLPRRNGFGAGLGLVDSVSPTPFPFVAVEFDTFQANEFSDPPYKHAGIDVNSMKSSNHTPWPSDILNGKTNDAWVTYDSSSKTLRVVFRGYDNDTHEPFTRDLEYRVDIKSVLPESVIFGFSAASGFYFEAHTLKSWSFSSTLADDGAKTSAPTKLDSEPTLPQPRTIHKDNKLGLVVGIGVGVTTIVLVAGILVWFYRRTREEETEDLGFDDTGMDKEFRTGTGPKKFSYNELFQATNKFAKEDKLGEGGFGGVYKGYLKEINSHVAVKSISKGSKQGVKEYASEVRIISRLRHKNLVQLIGWCHERRGLLLVYELMSQGSLDLHLFKEKSFLVWDQRYKIAQDIVAALFYLHEEWEQCVVHRDIKSSNVMLDEGFNAKLGDFGLARLVDHSKGAQTTVLAGTLGYLAPECSTTGKASKESDVYAFGIVLMEIACGRKPFDPFVGEEKRVLVQWVWDLYGRGRLFEAADPRLGGDFEEEQIERLMVVGLWCAHPDYNTRPSIKKASRVLNGESALPILPAKMPIPTYQARPDLYMSCSGSESGGRNTSSSNLTSSSSSSSPTPLLWASRND